MTDSPYAWPGGPDQKRRAVEGLRGWSGDLPSEDDPFGVAEALFGDADLNGLNELADRLLGGVAAVALMQKWAVRAAPDERAIALELVEAVPVGADLALVPSQAALWLLEDAEHGASARADATSRKAIDALAALYRRRLEGDEPAETEWAEARALAWNAGRESWKDLSSAFIRPWWDPRRYLPPRPGPTWRAAEAAKFLAAHGALGPSPFAARGDPPILRALGRAFDDVLGDIGPVMLVGAFRNPAADHTDAAGQIERTNRFVAAFAAMLGERLRGAPDKRQD